MKKYLEVETASAIYDIQFAQVQIEITGTCNMKCSHCRAFYQPRGDMPLNEIVKIVKFATKYGTEDQFITISGGEPTAHNQFKEVLKQVHKSGAERISITTNGSIFKPEYLDLTKDFKELVFSVSIDSLDPEKHNTFRGFKNAFQKAVKTIEMVTNANLPNVRACIRSSILPKQILEMEAMVQFAIELGCGAIGFAPIYPSGLAAENSELIMSLTEKQQFLNEIYRLQKAYPKFQLGTNDPLKCLVCGEQEIDEMLFNGCGAGVTMFNVEADGTITPCALLNVKMFSTFGLTMRQIEKGYSESEIIKSLLDREFGGKCGTCKLKYNCGGCRVRALATNGNYLGEDPDCWL